MNAKEAARTSTESMSPADKKELELIRAHIKTAALSSLRSCVVSSSKDGIATPVHRALEDDGYKVQVDWFFGDKPLEMTTREVWVSW